MELIDKTFALSCIPIFSSTELDLILSLADQLEEKTYQKNDLLFSSETINTFCYVLVNGSVVCQGSNPGSNWSKTLSAPYFFAEESAFTKKPKGYSCSFLEQSTCLTIHKSTLYKAIMESPEIALRILERLTNENFFPKTR